MDKRIALITGASRGIGRACARRLAKDGFYVAIGFHLGAEGAKETLNLVHEAGGTGELVQFDVSDTNACAGAVDKLMADYGHVDVLVNNAGVVGDKLLLRQSDEDWERLIKVNLTGPMALCRAVARHMLKQRSGSIVNVVSIIGEMGNAGQTGYGASKAGLLGLTKSLAREVASRGVRVNAVSPGLIDTEMTERLPDAARDHIVSQIPLGRLGTTDEVANAVAFLASDGASYITGEVLRVNGGLLT